MRDPYLVIITLVSIYPEMPLKFYIDASKLSRGTFFKVKGHLEELKIIKINDRKRILVDEEKGLDYLAEAYPGVTISLDRSRNGLPISNDVQQPSVITGSSAV